MIQQGDLVPNLTVREVVGFVRGLYPRPMPLDEVLELAGLTDLARRRTGRLSGGQAQQVRFAMAVAGAPEVLVLDEPTAALDVEARRAFWAAIRRYASGGRTVLFATHHLEEADENADRVVVVARGRIVADATPAEIKRRAGGPDRAVHPGRPARRRAGAAARRERRGGRRRRRHAAHRRPGHRGRRPLRHRPERSATWRSPPRARGRLPLPDLRRRLEGRAPC